MIRSSALFASILVLASVPAPSAGSDLPPLAGADALVMPLVPAITAVDLRVEVEFLASDENAGRLTGSPGIWRAAQFAAAAFGKAGLVPVPGLGSWYQEFEFVSGVTRVEGANRLEIAGGAPAPLDRDFTPLAYSAGGEVEGEVVFAGFGLVEPSTAGKGYDSYAGLDVKDRIVLILRDLPEGIPAARRQELALYAGDRYKAKLAADRGAKAVLLVIGPNSPNAGTLVRFNPNDRVSPISVPALCVSGTLAERILEPAGVPLKTLQDGLDGGLLNPHAAAVKGATVRLSAGVERVTSRCRNVVGMIPPSGGSEEYVIVGAHYDHIGTGEGLGSLAKQGEEGRIHNGADDNASGTAVVMELAAHFAAKEATGGAGPRRGMLFALWSGEELGLVGSDHFTGHPPVPIEKVAAYFNFDMVGRMRDRKLIVQAVGSSPGWRAMLERRNIPIGLSLAPQDDPWLPTDLTSFYGKKVPGLAFFTDLHEDYNRPTDDPATLNYDGMTMIADLARRVIEDARDPAAAIAYARVEQSAPPAGRMGRRVYTGIVPDFAGGSGVQGMRVSDVRAGGPAETAGIRGGDVIVEFAGKPVGSLQDYSDALNGAKPGEAAVVVVVRGAERLTLSVTPEVRRTD